MILSSKGASLAVHIHTLLQFSFAFLPSMMSPEASETADLVISRIVCASASHKDGASSLTPENLKKLSGSSTASPCTTGPPSLVDGASEVSDDSAVRDMSGLVSGMDLRKVLCPRLSSEIWH